jgi:anti-anti-sigma regulatory factor
MNGAVKSEFVPDFDIKHILLDCSCINFIDTQGIHAILEVKKFNFKV